MMLALIAATVLTQTTAQVPYLPASTKVAILPSVNTSGDKYVAMIKSQTAEADETLNRLFAEKGFAVLPADQVASALNASKIDLSDEDNERKDVLYGIGQSMGADILVFTAITKTWQKTTHDLLVGDKLEGFASVRTWVLDIPNKRPILAGKTFEGRSTKNGPTGSERQVRAVRLGIETQLKDFLKPFPKVPKEKRADQ